jgi:hypothetical protein
VDVLATDLEDAGIGDGGRVRLHIKRYAAARKPPANAEVAAFQLLQRENIPTAMLVGWGSTADSRSFVITEDLSGYAPADKLVESGTPFDRLLAPTADLTARLHGAGLHHRDLYLCHFMARRDEHENPEPKLIDVARVRRLPGWPTRNRWIVKDLAQYWYSTLALSVTDDQRAAWLARYAEKVGLTKVEALRRAIERKARSIARHDKRLNRAQPTRNVSIPD